MHSRVIIYFYFLSYLVVRTFYRNTPVILHNDLFLPLSFELSTEWCMVTVFKVHFPLVVAGLIYQYSDIYLLCVKWDVTIQSSSSPRLS